MVSFHRALEMHNGFQVDDQMEVIGYGWIWVFPKIGVPQNGWFIMENPIKWMILGYPYFWKHPYGWDRSAAPPTSGVEPRWTNSLRLLPSASLVPGQTSSILVRTKSVEPSYMWKGKREDIYT